MAFTVNPDGGGGGSSSGAPASNLMQDMKCDTNVQSNSQYLIAKDTSTVTDLAGCDTLCVASASENCK